MINSSIPPRFHVLAKPTGSKCNLDCAYCFYLKKEQLYPDSRFRMSDEVLERYIVQLIESHRSNIVTVTWQGGEPTLMGIDFFRRAIAFQKKHARPGMTFENSLQTNGTLLTDEWCQFLRNNDFLVGISIDGPRELHDAYRVNRVGKPTFDAVMRGLGLLQKHEVEHNILVSVNRRNADHPLEIYRFFRDDVGADWLQLIPVVERVGESAVSDRSVTPQQWGNFLVTIFDEWASNDVGRMFVQTFEAAVSKWMGMPTSGMCIFEPTCGYALALEHNGDLYACDHFVEPGHLLGNITQNHITELVSSQQQTEFGRNKHDSLPRECRECEVLFACQGECPRNRFTSTADGEPGLNYLCTGYKRFFRHIDQPMKILAQLLRRGMPSENAMQILAKAANGQQTAEQHRPKR